MTYQIFCRTPVVFTAHAFLPDSARPNPSFGSWYDLAFSYTRQPLLVCRHQCSPRATGPSLLPCLLDQHLLPVVFAPVSLTSCPQFSSILDVCHTCFPSHYHFFPLLPWSSVLILCPSSPSKLFLFLVLSLSSSPNH